MLQGRSFCSRTYVLCSNYQLASVNTSLFVFSEPPTSGDIFKYRPNETQDKYKNKLISESSSYFVIFKTLQNNICFFINNIFVSNTRLTFDSK